MTTPAENTNCCNSKEQMFFDLPDGKGQTAIEVVAENIVRIRCTPDRDTNEPVSEICVPRQPLTGKPVLTETGSGADIKCGELKISFNKKTGALLFYDSSGNVILRENPETPQTQEKILLRDFDYDPKSIRKIHTVDGGRVEGDLDKGAVTGHAWAISRHFNWEPDEALFGLGSHEENILNLRGTMQYLYQQNMKSVVPVLVSSKGYGLFFTTLCEMEFHDDAEGSFVKLCAAENLDYYFIYGPEFDRIIAGYRKLTGSVPMLPRWAFGYCQSKERYETQEEIVGIVKEYRKRGIPLDVIIQDWKYWPEGWGYKKFDQARFPDPSAMCSEIHAMNARILLSIWPRIRGCPESDEMNAKGFMLKDKEVYDAFSEKARAEYWRNANENLFVHGIDGWWCDCTEPCEGDWHGEKKPSREERRAINTKALHFVLGQKKLNAYSLFHSRGIYENQRKTNARKRVVNLTRSSYAGQQRYATITWSGDISANWETLAQQIPAGLNFTVTGCPYWTCDIGAFFVKKGEQWFWDGAFDNGVDDEKYRELYTRWFQYGAFLPMFRSHGTDTPREVWRFGKPGTPFYDALMTSIRLRYRLLPYIYSIAGHVTFEHYTMLRALAFDFRTDSRALDIKDQFMFGPALMVCPVTRPATETRKIYLPEGVWHDFWTGQLFDGGQTIMTDAPIGKIPIFVKAGSVVPMGPEIQHTGEKPDAPWELRVYPGKDGSFTVYEDEGDSYAYESGAFAKWQASWNNETQSLSIGKRQGSFPGMLEQRLLKLTISGENRAAGLLEGETAAEKVYSGEPDTIKPKSGSWQV